MSDKERSVLVVDDNQDVRDLVVHFLDSDGYHVFSASNGEDALAILNANQIDLVLLDIMMPGQSGLEVLEKIRTGKNKKIHNLPVMMITAMSSTDDIDKALQLGANAYIVKPFRGVNVREKVQSMFATTTEKK